MQQSTALLALVAIVAPAPCRAAEPALDFGRDGVRLGATRLAEPLRRAVRGAARRLGDPACAAVLDDFEDASGRSLRERLDRLALDPSTWTRRVLFYDGAGERRCRRDSRLLAFTAPGSRVVRACRALVALARVDPARAEVMVIHEVLHTLGLGEDPPTSLEITSRVRWRCGR